MWDFTQLHKALWFPVWCAFICKLSLPRKPWETLKCLNGNDKLFVDGSTNTNETNEQNATFSFLLIETWRLFLSIISVVQEEVFPPYAAWGWLVQSKLLQGREDLQRAKRNHFPGFLHGCGSGTLWILEVISGTETLIVEACWTRMTVCVFSQTGYPCWRRVC